MTGEKKGMGCLGTMFMYLLLFGFLWGVVEYADEGEVRIPVQVVILEIDNGLYTVYRTIIVPY